MLDERGLRRRYNVIIFILLIVFIVLNFVLGFIWYKSHQGFNNISARASNAGSINFSIESSVDFPRVVILHPEDGQTYSSHRNSLNYSVIDVGLESCWYSLDNGVTNTSVTCAENITGIISVSGANTWRVYANDTGGNVNFSTISFTVSLPGAPAAAAAAGGGGGTGGGAAPSRKVLYDFKLDQTLIKVSSKVGETFKKSVTVSNPNSVPLTFSVFTNMENMLYISEENFELAPGEDKTIYLTFVATEDLKPDVYTGKILFKTQYSEKELPVIYEVRSKKSLFDVSLNIPAKYKTLSAGDDLFFQVTILNLGEIGKVDVLMEYEVKDFDGRIIASLTETVAVETQASFSKTIKLPNDITSGDYVILARAKYGLSVATASDLFNVIDERFIFLSPENQFMFLFGLVFLILLILLFIIYELRKMRLRGAAASQHKSVADLKKKIRSGNLLAKDAELEIKKLNYQKTLLEEAYSKGYIKNDSYESGVMEINRLISRLKKRR